jgi:hypothetical protein
VDDGVGYEFAFPADFCPFELIAEAVVAERSGRQVDFSAVLAFACHEFTLRKELVELFDSEWFWRAHYLSLL